MSYNSDFFRKKIMIPDEHSEVNITALHCILVSGTAKLSIFATPN